MTGKRNQKLFQGFYTMSRCDKSKTVHCACVEMRICAGYVIRREEKKVRMSNCVKG